MSLSAKLYKVAMLAVGSSSTRGDTEVWRYDALEAHCRCSDMEE